VRTLPEPLAEIVGAGVGRETEASEAWRACFWLGWPAFFWLCMLLAIPGMPLLVKVAPWEGGDRKPGDGS
jgi:hypothetical protein